MTTKQKIAYCISDKNYDALSVHSTGYSYAEGPMQDNFPEAIKIACPERVTAGSWYQPWTGKFISAEEFNQAPEKYGLNAAKKNPPEPWAAVSKH
ncbi:hypothetical protein [Pseudomonas serboccidentalis]|uniref:hypothetical protein n=1 Tax=Pseudomonas serboccidentalis TaxID=2964670 RepID=UPI0039E1919E